MRRPLHLLRLALLAASLAAPVARAASIVQIRGGGNGHGVGMSQYGALGYAQRGASYDWILRHYYTGTGLAVLRSEPQVRVLLADGGAAAFSGAALASGVRLRPAVTYSVRALPGAQMGLTDDRGRQVARFTGAPLKVSGPGPLTLAGAGAYHGSLELRPDGSGGIETVDAVDLEDYVRGVISAEVPAFWPAAALEAQAIAARTYAITTDAGGGVFDQYSDTRSQMYRGIAAETPSTDAAAAATRGLVVVLGRRPVTTYFFASSGGATENVEDVWPRIGRAAWLRGVADPYDGAGGDPDHAWGLTLTAADAQRALGSLVKGRLIGIRVLRHGFSPRILTAQVVGSGGSTTVSGETLRRAFGLRTTLAAFTTISTRAITASARAPAVMQPLAALMPLVQAMVASLTPELAGRVFPGALGEPFILERRLHAGGADAWRAVAAGRLGPGGAFTLVPGAAGIYRIVVRGLTGPAVAVPVAPAR